MIIGTGRSAIGTLVERSTRFTILLHLPRAEGWRTAPPVKNGPALGGYGAEAMRAAIAAQMTTMPEQLPFVDLGPRHRARPARPAEDRHRDRVYFADPHSPWQRASNENTNGLLRQYFPKGTDLSRWNAEEIQAVAAALNGRPRKILAYKTPAEALNEHLLTR